jgi:hypothetical protein
LTPKIVDRAVAETKAKTAQSKGERRGRYSGWRIIRMSQEAKPTSTAKRKRKFLPVINGNKNKLVFIRGTKTTANREANTV